MANISDSSFFKKCQGILQKVKWILEFHELNERETKLFKSAITMVSLDKVKYTLDSQIEVGPTLTCLTNWHARLFISIVLF